MVTPDFQSLLLPAPLTARFSHPDYFIWCGSPVKDDVGRYHLFYSRWPRARGFEAWVTHSEIARAVADSPFGPWHHAAVVLPVRGVDFWDGLCTHNPTVLRFGDRYYLYYTGNTGDGLNTAGLNWTHRNNQRIGVAVADRPEGPWRRQDQPLIDGTPGFHDALCCANPSVTARPSGGYLLIYKGVADRSALPFGGPVVHIAALAEHPEGPFVKQPLPVFAAEGVAFSAEDPFVWWDGGRYQAIVKDMGGYFTGQGRSLARFESADGLAWKLAANPFVSGTEVVWEGGRRESLLALERPQLLLEGGAPVALCCSAMDIDECTFNVQIPTARG